MTVLLLPLAVAVAIGAITWFARLERRDEGITVVMILLALVLVETVLYPSQNDIPYSLFRPGVGTESFRLPEVVIVLALIARMLARGVPRRLSISGLWWVAFAAWVITAAMVGLMRDHPFDVVLFQAKIVLYLTGAMALATGVPAADYVGPKGLRRLVRPAAVVAAALVLTTVADLTFDIGLPGLPLSAVGIAGPDAASVFVVIGVVGLALGVARGHGRRIVALATVGPLLVAALFTDQRAVIVSLAVSVLVLIVASVTRAGRRRWRIPPTEAALFAAAALALVLVPSLGRAAVEESDIRLPLSAEVSQAFGGEGNEQSAQGRVNQWEAVRPLLQAKPVLGWGLGKTYPYFEPGPREFLQSETTHNVLTDLVLRTGAVGLILFLVALGLSAVEGLRVWRFHPHTAIAVLAIGALAAVAGLLARAMVEPGFEQYRLATTLGLMLGVLRSAASSLERDVAGVEPAARVDAWQSASG